MTSALEKQVLKTLKPEMWVKEHLKSQGACSGVRAHGYACKHTQSQNYPPPNPRTEEASKAICGTMGIQLTTVSHKHQNTS